MQAAHATSSSGEPLNLQLSMCAAQAISVSEILPPVVKISKPSLASVILVSKTDFVSSIFVWYCFLMGGTKWRVIFVSDLQIKVAKTNTIYYYL